MQATFPHLALWQEVQFSLTGQSLEGRQSISGAETVIPTLRGRWSASASFVLKGEGAVLQWQAFLAQMEGRIGTTLVPARSRWRPRDRDGHAIAFCQTGGLADAQSHEHFGFANTLISYMTVAAAAPLRATQIDVRNLNTTGLRPGQFFSIGERLHRVQAHWQPGAEGTSRLMFQPPLRAAVGAGTRVDLGRPVCKMRFATDDEGLFDQSMPVLPRVQVNFVEAS